MEDVGSLPSWVLAGMVAGWRPQPVLDYTLIVLLYVPPLPRLERLRQREQQRYGARIAPGGDMEATHVAFLRWSAGYDDGTSTGTNTLLRHQTFLDEASCATLRLDGELATAVQVERVLRSRVRPSAPR